MSSTTMRRVLASAVLAGVALAGCGGGDGSTPGTSTSTGATPGTPSAQAFAAAYGAGLSQMNTADGLTSATFHDQFAAGYLDAGTSKTQLVDGLKLDAAALAAGGTSLFPIAALSDVSLGACDAQGVCTLTATLTNTDADTTAVTFTTQVVITNGTLRLLGDQQAG